MRERPILRAEPGFFLLPGLLLLDREGIGWCYLLAATLHELSHGLAVYLLGGHITALTLGITGGRLRYRLPLSYPAEMAVTLAGSMVNFGMAAALVMRRNAPSMRLLAGASLILGALNLLPVAGLDGGAVIRILFALWERPEAGERLLFLCGGVICVGFWMMGLYIFVKTRYNSSMLWLAAALTGEMLGQRRSAAANRPKMKVF